MFLCHGSRLFGGKTFLAGLLAVVRMIFKRAEVFIMGGSEDQTAQMRQYIKSESEHTEGIWWNYKRAPRHLLGDITNDTVKLKNGASVTALPASSKAVRSKHGTDLLVDELDEAEWSVFTSALGQTYQGKRNINPITLMTSTWQYPDKSMALAMDEAELKGWSVYEWCYRETHSSVGGHVSDADLERKKGEMTDLQWRNEVELHRPEAGDLIFTPGVMDFLFAQPDAGSPLRDQIGIDYEFIKPSSGDFFYTGADWAKSQDFTVISTFMENPDGPDRLACWAMRQKEPWPIMINYLNKRVGEYGLPASFDGTGMGGQMIEDHLQVAAHPFDFARRRELHQNYSDYITACESGEFLLPPIPHLKKVYERLTREQVYESTRQSKKNHTPDAFVANALAYHAKTIGAMELLMGPAW